jgi:hypothetical protein
MSLPHGRARVNATSPSAFAICDRCGFLYNHRDLHWQYDYRGRSLANLRILVCETCEDTPQNQLKPRIIPPDPVAIPNARPERYRQYETNNRITQGNTVDFWTGLPVEGGNNRITESGANRVTQMTGAAPGNKNMFPGARFMVPSDVAEIGVPYESPGIPNTGRLTTIDNYVMWTNDPTNPAYWDNNYDDLMYWGA